MYLQRSVHNGTVRLSFLNSLFCSIERGLSFCPEKARGGDQGFGKHFQREFGAYGVWRGFWSRPWTLKPAEMSWKSFYFPHQTLVCTKPWVKRDLKVLHREKKNVYQCRSPPIFSKRPCNGVKMAGTNEFAFFCCISIRGGSRIRPKKFKKCLPTRSATKIYFSN